MGRLYLLLAAIIGIVLYAGAYACLSRHDVEAVPAHPGSYRAGYFFGFTPLDDAGEGIRSRVHPLERPSYYFFYPCVSLDRSLFRHVHPFDVHIEVGRDENGACSGTIERCLIRGVDF